MTKSTNASLQDAGNKQRTTGGHPGGHPPFAPGNTGRPKGSLNRTSLVAQILLDGQVACITEKCIEMALKGDSIAMKLCMDRILPPRKEWPVQFTMPPLQSGSDVAAAMAAVASAVADGKLLLSQAVDFAKLIESYNRTVNFASLTEIERMTDDEMRAAILRLQAMAATDADIVEVSASDDAINSE